MCATFATFLAPSEIETDFGAEKSKNCSGGPIYGDNGESTAN